jgi:hypothetical protein
MNYIIKLVSSGSELAGVGSVNADFTGAAQLKDTFGFFTVTTSLGGSIDLDSCALQICEDLLSTGLLTQSSRIALSLRVGFSLRKNDRGLLSTAILLSRLDLLNGRIRGRGTQLAMLTSCYCSNFVDCASLLLESRGLLAACGDPKLMTTYASVLSAAYCRLGEYGEAERICKDTMNALAGRMAISTTVINRSPDKTATNSKTHFSQPAVTEVSSEVADALAEVTGQWLVCLHMELCSLMHTVGVHHYKVSLFDLVEETWNQCGKC